jgi:hypothetical protein
MAASVPARTVSESLPATVTLRLASGLRHVSWEPVRRTGDHPAARSWATNIAVLLRHRNKVARAALRDKTRA